MTACNAIESAGSRTGRPCSATFENITRKRAVVIGISTGGPATLQEVLPQIPANVPASLFLVQHMPPAFIASFAKRLDDHCALKVVEARSGMPVEPSVCYVAPGGMHLCLHRKMTGEVVIRTPTTPADAVRPIGRSHDGFGSENLRELTPSAS